MMDTSNIVAAGKALREMGPKYVIVKKGEHGAMLFGEDKFFTCPAFPLHDVFDPTGAGDTFIGGFAGYLASLGKDEFSFDDLTSASPVRASALTLSKPSSKMLLTSVSRPSAATALSLDIATEKHSPLRPRLFTLAPL